MNEAFEALNDILDINQASLQKLNDNLVINFIFPLPGNKKKEIFISFKTRNEFQKNINEQLIKKVNDLEEKLNKEIGENKIYKTIINENKNVINELKEEIEILKSEIINLQKCHKEIQEKSEKEKGIEENNNIIKYQKDTKKDTKGKKEEEKKEILKTKYRIHVSDELKNNMKYLLYDKKKEVQEKVDRIEYFLNRYSELNTYLTKEFTLTKKANQSIKFFNKKEEEEIRQMAEIPKEVIMIIKCIYYIIDEPFDESMNGKQLYENLISNVLSKNEDKTFKSLLDNYFEHNKYLNLTKEKYDKINNIINENNVILNMITMTKMCRPISLFCFFLKEVHDYINLKTLDGQYYFDLRLKNDELQKYKDILYLIENDGKKREPSKLEDQPKAEEN